MPAESNSGEGFVPAEDEPLGLDAPAIAHAVANPAAIDHLSVGQKTFTSSNFAEPKRDSWRQEIASLGGPSPLLRFVDSPRTRIDLTAAHPGGLPRFLSGQPTLLEHLFREAFSLRNARLAAAADRSRRRPDHGKGAHRGRQDYDDLEFASHLARRHREDAWGEFANISK